jgi:U3 small nucleolar RNA-associated protein 19
MQMLEAELSKEVKKPPVVEFVIPKKIITKQDLGSDVQDTLLAKLWDFDV